MTYYHSTTLDNYQRIKSQGLIPKFPLYAKSPDKPMVYLSDSREIAESIYFQRVERGLIDHQQLVILSIQLNDDIEVYADPDTESGGYMTPSRIYPKQITVEYCSPPIVTNTTDLF